MSENDAGIEINVEVPEITPEPAPAAEPVVTVIDAGNEGTAAPLADATIDHEGRITGLELGQATILEKLEEIANAVAVTAVVAEVQQEEIAEVREEIAEVAEDQQPDPEEDEEPVREHPFYRSRKLFGKAD